MKLKHLIALIALTLGLASGAVGAPDIAGRKPGASGGSEIYAGLAAPAIASSKPNSGGDIDPYAGAPAIAGGGVRTGDISF